MCSTIRPTCLAGGLLVVVCDSLFREVIDTDCGGPAEDALVEDLDGAASAASLVERFEAAPGLDDLALPAPAGLADHPRNVRTPAPQKPGVRDS